MGINIQIFHVILGTECVPLLCPISHGSERENFNGETHHQINQERARNFIEKLRDLQQLGSGRGEVYKENNGFKTARDTQVMLGACALAGGRSHAYSRVNV